MKIRFKPGSLWVNLALLVVSTIVTLLLSEMALRAFGFEPLYVSPERDRFWRYDSLLGWAHAPGQEGTFETLQFRTSLQINQKGLRDEEHAYEREPGSRRILVLGDSFAWGYGVEESERFSELLEKRLGIEVINAGVSGYSTDQELLWLNSEGFKYEVDLVVLVFAGNDIGDNLRQLINTIYYKPQLIRENGHLTLINSPVPKASTLEKSVYILSQRSALAYFLVQRYFDLQSFYGRIKADARQSSLLEVNKESSAEAREKPVSEAFDITLALLDAIRMSADSREAEFMIVATDGWWNPPSGESYKEFIEALELHGFLVLDVTEAAGFDPGQMKIPDDGHWNRTGHEFVALKIEEFIKSFQLLGQQ